MSIAKLIRILLVDDDALVRQALRSALQPYPNIEVVGEGANGGEGVSKAAQLQPTVVVMDINMMSKMDGIMATQVIKTQHPQIVVLGLSVDPKSYLVHAMEIAGASEVLKKDNAGTDLYGAIQRAVAAVQPVLILEETPSSDGAQSEKPAEDLAPTEPLPMNEPKM